MTALNQYDRLEATAIWKPDTESQRRDVFVSLGEATLVIQDGKDVALTHWSLPAVIRLNPGAMPARYAPGQDTGEELEIADPTMIDAIEKIRSVVLRDTSWRKRMRRVTLYAVLAGLVAAGVYWAPSALVRQTAGIVPEATRSEISRQVLDELRTLTGAPCHTPEGNLALARLSSHLLPDGSGRLLVVPDGILDARHLPDKTIILGRQLVEDFEGPEVAAAFVLVEAERIAQRDPLETMLSEHGLNASFRLLTTGQLPDATIKSHAEALVARTDHKPPAADLLMPRFAQAGVRMAPYAYAIDVTGESTVSLIEADPVLPSAAAPLLNDAAWVALQSICGE